MYLQESAKRVTAEMAKMNIAASKMARAVRRRAAQVDEESETSVLCSHCLITIDEKSLKSFQGFD